MGSEAEEGDNAGLRTWARAVVVDPVAARVRAMPPGRVEGTARVPFPQVDRETYLGHIRGSGIPKRSLTAPKVRVSLDKLSAIQGSINKERLQQHVADPEMIARGSRSPGSGMLTDLPVVVKTGGALYIHDGHHRLTAAKMRGQKDARVRLVDLDKE